jgi:hypothetical protein
MDEEALMEIYSRVWEKIETKLGHKDFKIHPLLPAGYRGDEKPEDIASINVHAKNKKVTVEFKDGHEIEVGFDPEGRYNEWAHGARVATPEEREASAKRQAARDKLIEAHRRGEMSDKAFDEAIEREWQKGEKELRKRWKEMHRK